MDIFESMRQLISGVDNVTTRTGPHFKQDDACVDCDYVATVVVLKGFGVFVALLRTGCLVSRSTHRRTTNLGSFAFYVDE